MMLRDCMATAAIVVALMMSPVGRPDGGGGTQADERDEIRAVVQASEAIARWMSAELGQNALRGVVMYDGVLYLYGEDLLREAGRIRMTCRDETEALKLLRTLSARKGFRTKKIATLYVAKRSGNVISLFFRQGIESISADPECDLECQVGVLERRRGAHGRGVGSGVPARGVSPVNPGQEVPSKPEMK